MGIFDFLLGKGKLKPQVRELASSGATNAPCKRLLLLPHGNEQSAYAAREGRFDASPSRHSTV